MNDHARSPFEESVTQNEWFRVTLASIGDAVIATDAKGKVSYLNPIAEDLTGWSQDEAQGVPLDEVFKIISEETREPVENPVTKALRANDVVGLANHTSLIRKDGQEVSIADSAAPIRDRDGNTIGVVLVFRDVTEQRKAETAVRDAKEYAENIVATIRHPLLVLDSNLRVQTANRSFYRAFEVLPNETEGKLVYDLGNGQWDIPELRRLLTEILPDNTSFDDYEVHHEFPSIGTRYMRLNARRMYREGNHTELILLAIEDVTKQRLAEEERKELETRFTSLVKNIKDHSIFTLDPDGHITSWNHEAENILGFGEEEAIGRHFSMIFTPEDVAQGVPQHELDTARTTGRAEDERWHLRKNGELFWALGIVTPTTDISGKHTGYSKILRDMTERKQAQEALLRQSSQLRLLWDAAAVLLTALDPEAMLRKVYDRIQEDLDVDAYFHYAVDASRQCMSLVSCGGVPETQVNDLETLQFNETVCGTVAIARKPWIAADIQESHDSRLDILKSLGIRACACNPLIFDDELIGTLSFASRTLGKFDDEALAFFQTICQYVTVAYARLRLVEELRDTHQRKDEFLAMLAHELRNPLAPIRSGLDLLALEQPATHHETIELMQAQMDHVVRLVDDLMDVSRIMRGRVELRPQPVDLEALVRQSVSAIRSLVDSQGQQLVVSIPDERVRLNADTVRLVQVLENLLNNASKYTDAGGRIELTAEVRDDEVWISVGDSGMGIDPDLLPVIFDLFTQSPRSLDRSQGGLGIGLTLVKNLVELHGGSISVQSEGLGAGSTFLVRLPVLQTSAPPSPPPRPPAATPRRRIVAVDDNIGAARMLALLLTKLGDHEVVTVHDGPSVVAKVQEFQPDIVLLDIGLPGMDGYEVGRAIRAEPKLQDVLLVALTGYGQEEDHRKSKEAGFDEHLVKPPSVDQIHAILTHPKLDGMATE